MWHATGGVAALQEGWLPRPGSGREDAGAMVMVGRDGEALLMMTLESGWLWFVVKIR